jgi:predicted outer membrane repeat protein
MKKTTIPLFFIFMLLCSSIPESVLAVSTAPIIGSTIYVDITNIAGPWDGTSEHPFKHIQEGINAASNWDTVLVLPGTYAENIRFKGKHISVQSEQGPQLTIIDGHHNGSTVQFINHENANSILSGFTVTNGTGTLIPPYQYGGGICCTSSSPTIMNNIITRNTGYHGGGIMSYMGASPTISNNLICNNQAETFGGGIYFTSATGTATQNSILNNSASSGGGIACAYNSHPTIHNNTISNNSAECGGGLFTYYGSNPSITSNNITKNVAVDFGGGLCCDDSAPTVTGNSFVQNSANLGGGIYCTSQRTPVIYHNNFVVNIQNAYDEETSIWDNDYPSGGNYWDDYEERYPDAQEIGDSGIWDTPYTIEDGDNQDRYPLIDPWGDLGYQAPIVKITSPKENEYVRGLLAIQGSSSDPDGNETIVRVEVKIDAGSWYEATGITTWNMTVNTSLFDDGAHTIFARSYDGVLYSTIAFVHVRFVNYDTPHLRIGNVYTGNRIEIDIHNDAFADAYNVEWFIKITKGILLFPRGGTCSGNITYLAEHDSTSIHTNVFGFGRVDVTISVKEPTGSIDTKNIRVFLFFTKVLG